MKLTPNQQKFLSKVHFAVVSTLASNGMPHQTVMWYMLNGDELLLSTPHNSLKHKHLKKDNRISICIEKGYEYVTITGKVRLNEEPISARADYDKLGKRYRGTFNPLMILRFILRDVLKRLKPKPTTASAPQADTNRMQDMLSRERVTLHVEIEKVHSNSLD